MNWLKEEDAFLRDHYSNLGAKRCAMLLKRSVASVHRRAHRLRSLMSNPYFRETGYFDYNKPTTLYFISLNIEGDTLYKIGITNKTVQERMGSDFNRFNCKIEWEQQFSTGREAYTKEQELLKQYKDKLVNTNKLISGNSETLSVFIEEGV